MKKLSILIIIFILFSCSKQPIMSDESKIRIHESMEADGVQFKNDIRESILSFGDSTYIPGWLNDSVFLATQD
jgi:hypothetical protein